MQFCGFLICLCVIIIMAYFGFVTVQFLSYPWWVGLGSDGDGTYITQTLTLLNHGTLELVMHPGASAYGLLGIILRAVATIDPTHAYLRLPHLQTPAEVFALLDDALHVARLSIALLNVFCFLVFWKVLYQMSRNFLFSLGLAAFFITTYFMMDQRLFILRPEIFSFVFCVLLLALLLNISEKSRAQKPIGLMSMIMVGLLAGLAILGKIQVSVLIACLFVWWIFFLPVSLKKTLDNKITWIAVVSSLLNFVIMPWQWCKRPDFLIDYLKQLYHGHEMRLIYGNVPETVAPVYIKALGVLLFCSVLTLGWRHRYTHVIAGKLLKINLIVTGIILSCYGVFLALGLTLSEYNAACNHLLYTVTTNVFSGGTTNHRVIDGLTFKAIINAHSANKLLGISILWYVVISVGICIVRILQRTVAMKQYALILIIFVLAFSVDILSTFRQYNDYQVIIVSSYLIYSLPVYLCAMALLFAQEMTLKLRLWKFELKQIICVALIVNIIFIAVRVVNIPKWDAAHNLGQTEEQEMRNVMSYVPGFWHMASQGRM